MPITDKNTLASEATTTEDPLQALENMLKQLKTDTHCVGFCHLLACFSCSPLACIQSFCGHCQSPGAGQFSTKSKPLADILRPDAHLLIRDIEDAIKYIKNPPVEASADFLCWRIPAMTSALSYQYETLGYEALYKKSGTLVILPALTKNGVFPQPGNGTHSKQSAQATASQSGTEVSLRQST